MSASPSNDVYKSKCLIQQCLNAKLKLNENDENSSVEVGLTRILQGFINFSEKFR